MPVSFSALLVESREAIPDSVIQWTCDLLDDGEFPHYIHSEEGFLIINIAPLLHLAQEARENPDLPTPPGEVVRWLRRQAAAARRQKAARFIWIG